VSSVSAQAVPARRWTFVALLSTATFINYLDRGSLSVALPFISQDLHLDPVNQGLALSSFFWTYALMQVPMGWIVDRFDLRKVYAIAFGLWSLSAAGTGLARGLGSLIFFRVLLGIGESVYLPGGMKMVSRHFRAAESAWPAGLFDLGAKVGLACGTAIDVWLLVKFGWRSLFFRTGLAGLLWLIPWLLWYPATRPAPAASRPRVNWSGLLDNRALIAMSVGFFCWDYFWYFLISWLPSYLYEVRHVQMVKVALFGSLPYLIFAAAEAAGAWMGGRLVARGADLSRVTKTFVAAGFALGVLVVPAAFVDSPTLSIAFLMAAATSGIACGHLLAIPRISAPDHEVALWTGFQNFIGNLAGVVGPVITGYAIARTGSYVSSFLVVGVVLVIGIAAYVFWLPRLPSSGDPV
jgi:ACS family D-galactonate transporter-like MFS transporter